MQAGKAGSDLQPTVMPAKAKTKNQESAKLCAKAGDPIDPPAAKGLDEWFTSIRGVTGNIFMDASVVRAWMSEDVNREHTALPTIASVLDRELKRTGKPPKRLAYYRDAVLEAAKSQNTTQHNQAAKEEFQLANEAHWRQLLGDPKSRFRGDYMAQNWFIPGDHPDFFERGLGPNPRFCKNTSVPAAICDEYARGWLWL